MHAAAGVGVQPTAGVVVFVERSRGQSTVFAGGQVLSSTPLAQRWEASGQALGSLSLSGTSFSISQSLSVPYLGLPPCLRASLFLISGLCVCAPVHMCVSPWFCLSLCASVSLCPCLSLSLTGSVSLCPSPAPHVWPRVQMNGTMLLLAARTSCSTGQREAKKTSAL